LCRRVLKKYPKIEDILIFGSFVRGKAEPKDVDIGIMIDKYGSAAGLIGKIGFEFKAHKIDIEIIDSRLSHLDPLFWRIAKDGFSIKADKWVRKIIDAKPMTLFGYSLKSLNQTKKVQFNRAVHNMLKETKGIKLGPGMPVVPTSKSESFQELLDSWHLKKAKRFDVIFMEKVPI